MAIAASNASGASGLVGLLPPAPPPVLGSDVTPPPAGCSRVAALVVVPRVDRLVWDSLPALFELYRYVPPPPGEGWVGCTTGTALTLVGDGLAVAGGGAVVGDAVGDAVGVGVLVLFGFGVFVGDGGTVVSVGDGAAVAEAATVGMVVAVGSGVGVTVEVAVGGPGGAPIAVGINVGGGGGVAADANVWDAGECITPPMAIRPTDTGNAMPIVSRLFIQDSLRSSLRSGRLVAAGHCVPAVSLSVCVKSASSIHWLCETVPVGPHSDRRIEESQPCVALFIPPFFYAARHETNMFDLNSSILLARVRSVNVDFTLPSFDLHVTLMNRKRAGRRIGFAVVASGTYFSHLASQPATEKACFEGTSGGAAVSVVSFCEQFDH